MPYIAVPVAELKRCKNPAPVDLRLMIYPRVGHDAWTPTYRRADVFAWLLRRSARARVSRLRTAAILLRI
jgi:hypothetical protein